MWVITSWTIKLVQQVRWRCWSMCLLLFKKAISIHQVLIQCAESVIFIKKVHRTLSKSDHGVITARKGSQ